MRLSIENLHAWRATGARMTFVTGLFLLMLPLGAARVGAQVPPGYYDTVDLTNSSTAHATLHEIIDDHTRFPYTSSSTDTWDILNLADEDPNNINNILDVYKNASYTKIPGGVGAYNREHVWPKSYGFPNDNVDNYPYTDCHHLMAADGGYNSSRSNKPFRFCNAGCSEKTTDVNNGGGGGSGVYPGNSNWTTGSFAQGTWETWGGRRGDVARAIFYMAVRYDGGTHSVTGSPEPDLIVTDSETLIDSSNTGTNESVAYMGMLSDLLTWHYADPVGDDELWHNEVVASFQGNRNPFVDHPEWVACVFQNLCAPDSTPPAAPTGLTATPGDTSITLDWTANTEPDLAGYNLFRSTTSGGPYTQVNGSIISGTTTMDTGLTNGTTYFYVLQAVDTSSNSSTDSNEASATPQGGGGGPGQGQVVLSEVFYNPSGSDDGLEWVELYNAGTSAVDLSTHSLGNGGTSYTYSTVQLSGTIAPGATFVVGGATSNGTNFNPSFDLIVNFSPDFQNSGSTADGVALFDVPTAQISSSVPIDAVVYGSSNTNGLIDETGAANPPEVGNAATGSSIERVDLAGAWQTQGTPNPNATTLPPPSGGNNVPVVTITAPTDGSSFTEGSTVAFTGSASDTEDGDVTASLAWVSDLDGALGTGGSASAVLSIGAHTITATATDSQSATGQASITVTVTANATPVVTITAPADGSSFTDGTTVNFAGSASDAEDGDVTASLAWVSDLDGALGIGGSASAVLSIGIHTITASVTDSFGATGQAAITVTIAANVAPTVSITAPADGSSFNTGTSVSFAGTASDPEDGDLTASLAWTSDLEGALGTGGGFAATLTVIGAHTITAETTDSGGLPGSDAISVTVTVVTNTAPSVAINSPADGSSFSEGATVTFTGSADDAEDGDLTSSISWSSDLDGALGSGASVATATLSVGSHTVSASVTDSGSLTATDQIAVTITSAGPSTLTVTSIAADDGWVRESSENSNVGGRHNATSSGGSSIRAGDHKKDRQYLSIVSFDTSSIPAGATIISATLRLRRGGLSGTNPFSTHGAMWVDVSNGGFGGSAALAKSDFEAAATVSQVATMSNAASNGDWSEGSLNAAGLAAINLSGVTQLRFYFDLDDNDDGGNDYIGYYSANNGTASNHPELVIEYQP